MTYTAPTLEESGSVSIALLKDRHKDQIAYIVGKGPSIQYLRASDFGPGPVITLNEAIAQVQILGLPNHIYSMQKDGCVTADQNTIPRPCGSCAQFGWKRDPVIDPFPGIATIFSQHLSSWCLHGRRNRYVFTDEELGYAGYPFTMSVLEAIPFAKHMGAVAITMVCCDYLVTGDDSYNMNYTDEALKLAQSNLAWVKPRVIESLKNFGPHAFYVPTP